MENQTQPHLKPDIYVLLMGRIGNNLFQIATAATLAHRNGCNFKAVPMNYRLAAPDNCLFKDYLEQFRTTVLRNTPITEIYPEGYRLYSEPSFEYTPIEYEQCLLLSGYFQSEKYFDKTLVRELFKIDPGTEKKLKSMYKHLSLEETVSINIRRGDYLWQRKIHPVCGMEYYNSAINLLGEKRNYLITSDDLTWCKAHFTGKNFFFARQTDPVTDLYLQTLCCDNIISNSTFSWWGAWLTAHPEKTVIAPAGWFGPQSPNTSTRDLLPEEWIVI